MNSSRTRTLPSDLKSISGTSRRENLFEAIRTVILLFFIAAVLLVVVFVGVLFHPIA